MTAQPVETDLAPAAPGHRLRLLPVPVSEPGLPPPVGVVPTATALPTAEGAEQPVEPVVEPVVVTPPRTLPGPVGTASAPTAVDRRPGARLSAPALPLVVPADDEDRARPARPTPTADLPGPDHWTRQFVQAAAEVAVGLRPAAQLVRWTTEDVYGRLARRGEVALRARSAGRLGAIPGPTGRPRVRSVRTCELRDGIVEASAVVNDAERSRAVALRLEGLDGRWRVTVLELG